jgi:hypothetical protein
MPHRPYAAAAATGAALLTLLATLLAAGPAQALPPTTRTLKDAVEPGKGYDIVQVSMHSAAKSTGNAVVLVKHGRKVATGDSIDVWFDLDGDRVPDIHVSGDAFSEFTVHKTKSFTKDGKDISGKDCARLAMAGSASKITLSPTCVGAPIGFAVAVKSSADGKPASTDDWAPGTEKFSKKVLAAPLT